MADARWAYYKIEAWASIAGVNCDVVGFVLNFELNAMPFGEIQLPTGIAEDGTVAAIHSIVAGLKNQTPVTVFGRLVIDTKSDSAVLPLGIPANNAFILFQGLTSGGGYDRSASSSNYVLSINHILVRLNQASSLSDSSHPANPFDFSYGAIMHDALDTGTRGAWTPLQLAEKFITPAQLNKDIWGNAFFPWFLALTKRDGFQVKQKPNLTRGEKTNSQARSALVLLRPFGPGYQQIRIKRDIRVDEHVANHMSKDLSNLTHNPGPVANQTLWDILIGNLLPDYLLAFVPTAEGGLIVPYMPGTRGTTPINITAEQISHMALKMTTPRPLRGIGIQAGVGSSSAALNPNASKLLGIGGWYDVAGDGYIKIERGPHWTSEMLSKSLYTAETSGGNLKPVANAHHPGVGAANKAGDKEVDQAKNVTKPFLDAFAKARFAQEVLRGRFGVVSGPFRLDIVPGATVKIEGAREQFIGAADKLGQIYFGEVLRVTLQMMSAPGANIAGTSFHVGYLRTESEHKDEKLTIDTHPLYTNIFQANKLALIKEQGTE